jgi:hypothetical protein
MNIPHIKEWLGQIEQNIKNNGAHRNAGSWERQAATLREILKEQPLTLPDPPEGEEFLNTYNLTAEQFALEPGVRPRMKSERGQQPNDDEYWCSVNCPRKPAYLITRIDSNTYRTRAPIPTKPVLVPFGPEDVKPGDTIQPADKSFESLIIYKNDVVIGFIRLDHVERQRTWANLQSEGWLINGKRAEKEGK